NPFELSALPEDCLAEILTWSPCLSRILLGSTSRHFQKIVKINFLQGKTIRFDQRALEFERELGGHASPSTFKYFIDHGWPFVLVDVFRSSASAKNIPILEMF